MDPLWFVEGVWLKGGALVPLLVGRADRVGPVRHGRARHTRDQARPPHTGGGAPRPRQVLVRVIRGLGPVKRILCALKDQYFFLSKKRINISLSIFRYTSVLDVFSSLQ